MTKRIPLPGVPDSVVDVVAVAVSAVVEELEVDTPPESVEPVAVSLETVIVDPDGLPVRLGSGPTGQAIIISTSEKPSREYDPL